MKRILAFALCLVLLVLSLVACKNETGGEESVPNGEQTNPPATDSTAPQAPSTPAIPTFTELENGKTLYVYDATSTPHKFYNYEDSNSIPQFLPYEREVTYSLYRTDTYRPNAVLYNGYYYSWEKQGVVTDYVELGNKTVTESYVYSYLPYGDGNNIAVKCTITTKTVCDYEDSILKKDCKVTTYLNGYFDSMEKLEELCPQLAQRIEGANVAELRVDATTPSYVTYNTNTYMDVFYTIETNQSNIQ